MKNLYLLFRLVNLCLILFFSSLSLNNVFAQTIACEAQVNVSLDPNLSVTTVSADAFVAFSGAPTLEIRRAASSCTPASAYGPSIDFYCCEVGESFLFFVRDAVSLNECWGTVTVEDKFAPTAICFDQVNVSLGLDGTAVVTPDMIDAGSIDNCNIANMLIKRGASECAPESAYAPSITFDCCDVGNTIQVFIRVEDQDGNFNECWGNVTIEDKLNSPLICLADISASLDASGQLILFPDDVILPYTDNCTDNISIKRAASSCGPESAYAPSVSFDCCDAGNTIQVFVRVTDANGDFNECWTNVNIQNNTSSSIACFADINLSLDVNGEGILTPDDVILPVTGNCIDNISIKRTASSCAAESAYLPSITFDCCDVGNTIQVFVRVTDVNGDFNECWGNVTIEDKLPPSFVEPFPDEIEFSCGDVDPITQPPATDNCDVLYSYEDLILSICGESTKVLRTWTICDPQFNCAEPKIQVITFTDFNAPVFINPPTDLCGVDALTWAEYAAYDPNVIIEEDCGEYTTEVEVTINCDTESLTQQYTATDECGNFSTVLQEICISDFAPSCSINPPGTVICGSLGNTLSANITGGLAPYTSFWTSSNAGWTISDVTDIDDMSSATLDVGTGASTVTIFVVDANGCTGTYSCDINLTCSALAPIYTTFTQNFFGDPSQDFEGNSSLEIIEDILANSGTIVLGIPGQSVSFAPSTASCISAFLPQNGKAEALPDDIGDAVVGDAPFCSFNTLPDFNLFNYNNKLLSESLTLALNIAYDPNLANLRLSESCVNIPNHIYDQLGDDATVGDLMNYANEGLGGLVSKKNLKKIHQAVRRINRYFDFGNSPCPAMDFRMGNETVAEAVSIKANEMTLSPNPVSHAVNIAFESTHTTTATLSVYDLTGKLILQIPQNLTEGYNKINLDLSSLNAGIYIIQMQNEVINLNKKFVKT